MVYESEIEKTIISLLQNKGYELIDKNDDWISKRNLDEFINKKLLRERLIKINKISNENVIQSAINTIERLDNPSLFERNFAFHKILIDGITIESKDFKVNPLIRFIDFINPENNVFQVCHQIKFNEGRSSRIPDVIVYINGLPLIVMELKSFDEDAINATLEHAYAQLGSNSEHNGYRYDIPTLFNYNAFLVISDGVHAKVGTLTSKIDRYNEWKSISGEKGYDDSCVTKLNVLFEGLFDKNRLLDVIKNNIFFIIDKNEKPVKIMSQYHQYFGVNKALSSIIKTVKANNGGKAGIVWHAQGSGKSFSMVMLAHRLLMEKSLGVPTIVILTDRIDLDNQLYKTFFSAKNYLKCEPVEVNSRADLVKKLNSIKQGGIILTTVGKFDKENLPKNERSNIIVMTDEAHRGHYGIYETVRYERNDETDELEAVFKYGVEKYIRDALPNATFIGFTGTPVSNKDKQTTDIFGDIVDTYDITQSVIDGSTVKLCYESRLAKVWTDEKVLKQIDEYYNNLENTAKSDSNSIERSKAEMSKIKIILEDDDMIKLFATDILEHYEGRKGFLNGKAMIICQTRNAAAKLYHEILKQRPEYKETTILVVTESNKDSDEQRKLFGNSDYRKELGNEFKKETSKYKIAIVCDMWLTGFDVPDLDVMYFIKRLKSHNLMQAIARVNRVYSGKEYGLIVDYIGLNKALDDALTEYTDRDQDRTQNLQDVKKEIYAILKDKLNALNNLFSNVKEKERFYSKDALTKFSAIQKGAEFVLSDKKRCEDTFIKDLSIAVKQAFIVCAGTLTFDEKNDALYYLAIRSYILRLRNKTTIVSTKDMNEYVSNLLADAIKGDEVKVLTSYKSDSIKKDISINKDGSINLIELLNKEKIEELRKKNPPHIFVEIAKKLLEKSISESRRNNYIKSQEYSKKLIRILEKYNDRDSSFTPDATIIDLVNFASEIVFDEKQANKLGIFGREKAFYDALVYKPLDRLLSDETLKLIVKELKDVVEKYALTDWANKEATRAKMRNKIKECLKKYNYPPEYTDLAILNVIKQAEYMYA
ncbi:type I restriction endonuclease subunit R [Metamycoplasma hyosynoviae]|uniref:type I restriction endonuclease subunit R n=1 Tax=Metamycoplasma hyosynoviae TaxID=29559 RepID=UPI0023615B2C|nr:type I restriction endonuclease subunit R [Metamycoplasma hyosynoviae]MDD1375069.1 type I restriction endonuclease subunit R [Metamycoplasma hyosynoviae]